ncbi:MAG: HicB family protein [Acidobacteria bacterium]|nr:MAG: HicB family protein [Acidobacteriota bacterium]
MAARRHFTLEYWLDDGWYVGRITELPGVFSQGATLEELEENIKDAYALMLNDHTSHPGSKTKEIALETK